MRGIRLLVCLAIMIVPQLSLSAPGPREASGIITIRVINSKTGKPLNKVSVTVEDTAGHFVKDEKGKVVTGITNKLGEVALRLPSPVPERLRVFYSGGGTCELMQCSSSETFATTEVLKTGIVATNRCSGPNDIYNVSPRPGELVIFGKPFSGRECTMLEMP